MLQDRILPLQNRQVSSSLQEISSGICGKAISMMGILLLIFIIATGFVILGATLYHGTRRGEDCRGYPYNCPVCRHAAECIIEIGREKDDA